MRFVVLFHRGHKDHFDLMIEREHVLDTWRISRMAHAALVAGLPVKALKIQPHRTAYLDYEGPVSCDKGSVCVYDSGEYHGTIPVSGKCVIDLEGRHMCGRLAVSMIESTRPFLKLRNSGGPCQAIRALSLTIKICCNRRAVP